ncbi:MAG TPA: hypothetical protein V6D18_20525 [Thermosynechococcaceae cyanobacterium]
MLFALVGDEGFRLARRGMWQCLNTHEADNESVRAPVEVARTVHEETRHDVTVVAQRRTPALAEHLG